MSHAIDLHAHESCMHVAVRVLHSYAFIFLCGLVCFLAVIIAVWLFPCLLRYYGGTNAGYRLTSVCVCSVSCCKVDVIHNCIALGYICLHWSHYHSWHATCVCKGCMLWPCVLSPRFLFVLCFAGQSSRGRGKEALVVAECLIQLRYMSQRLSVYIVT